MAIQLNFVDFVSLLRLSHFGLKTQFWDFRAFCKSSARAHEPHLRFTRGATTCSLFAQDTCARQGVSSGHFWSRRTITLIYWLWNALIFSTQRRSCTHCTDHTVTKCKFFTLSERNCAHFIRAERSICGWWWGYILKAWLSPPYTVGQLQHKKEILVVLTLFGSSEDSPGSHKLSRDTHYSRLTMGYQG